MAVRHRIIAEREAYYVLGVSEHHSHGSHVNGIYLVVCHSKKGCQ